MVMPRSRSRSMESSTWASISRSLKPPQIWMKRSARVDLPWSMWAMIEKLRIRLRSLTAGFFQRWFARHGGDRGVPPKTARKCTRFRYGTPSVPVCARARRPGHTPAEAGLFGQTEGGVAGASLTDDAHGDGAVDRQLPGNLLEVRRGRDRAVGQVGGRIAGPRAEHGGRAGARLTHRHTGIEAQRGVPPRRRVAAGETDAVVGGRGRSGGWGARRGQGVDGGERGDFHGQR